MADEDKIAEETVSPALRAEDAKTEKKELAALKKQVADSGVIITRQEAKIVEGGVIIVRLEARIKELEEKLAKQQSSSSDIVIGSVVKHKCSDYKIVDIDLAWEVGQKVERDFVEEDAVTLVLKKL